MAHIVLYGDWFQPWIAKRRETSPPPKVSRLALRGHFFVCDTNVFTKLLSFNFVGTGLGKLFVSIGFQKVEQTGIGVAIAGAREGIAAT